MVRRARGSESAPRDHGGFQLSHCEQSPYSSYFFLLVFECRCAHTRETPDRCIDQTVSTRWPSSCTCPTHPLHVPFVPGGTQNMTQVCPEACTGALPSEPPRKFLNKAVCRNDLRSLFSNTSSLPLPCSLHQGIWILVNKGVILHLAMCFQKLQKRCENYYLWESKLALCGPSHVLPNGAKKPKASF